MIPKARLDTVTEADMLALIDHGVRESRTLDYKRAWPAERDARIELAKDVCAFANTLGGDLVCPRRLNFEPPRRLNFEPGWRPV